MRRPAEEFGHQRAQSQDEDLRPLQVRSPFTAARHSKLEELSLPAEHPEPVTRPDTRPPGNMNVQQDGS